MSAEIPVSTRILVLSEIDSGFDLRNIFKGQEARVNKKLKLSKPAKGVSFRLDLRIVLIRVMQIAVLGSGWRAANTENGDTKMRYAVPLTLAALQAQKPHQRMLRISMLHHDSFCNCTKCVRKEADAIAMREELQTDGPTQIFAGTLEDMPPHLRAVLDQMLRPSDEGDENTPFKPKTI